MKVADWKCKNGHVMGQVVRNGSNVRQLLLFREAVGPDDEFEVMALVEGYAADVRCSVCGAVRTWVPGQEAIDRLVEHVLAIRASA